MVGKNDDLIISVSTDTSTIARSLNKLVGDVDASASRIQSRFEGIGKGIDKSMTTSLQNQINGIVGIGVKATKEWTGALADQGKAFDTLRSKYSPLFAAQQTYLANLAQIKTAHGIGAISSDEMSMAIVREKAMFDSNVNAINKHDAALGRVGGSAKLTSNQMLNLSRQGNDVLTMFAMGAPPMQIFASQAGQIYGALEEGPQGLRGSLKAVGEGVMGLITRFPLATAAIAATGVAIGVYALLGPKALITVDEALKKHGELIKDLKAYYDGSSASAEKYGKTAGITLDAIIRKQAEAAKPVAAKENANFFAKAQLSGFVTGSDQFVVASQFKAAAPAILKFREDLAKGKGDFDAFKEAIQNSALGQKLKDQLIEGAQGIREINDAANVSPPNEYQKALADLSSTANGLKNSEAKTALQELIEKFKNGEISAKDLIHEIDLLSGKSLDLSSMTSELDKLIKKAEDAKFSIGNVPLAAAAYGARPSEAGQTGGRVGKQSTKDALDQAQALFEERFNFEQRFGGPELQKLITKNKELNKPPKKPKVDKDANAERDNLKRGQDRIDKLKQEADAIGLTGTAQDTLRFKLELLQKATDKGRQLNPAYIAEIEKLAEAYGKAAEKVAFLRAQQDLTFEREQMFRSPSEQRVYSTLKSAGLDPNSESGQMLASQIRLNEALSTGRDLALDFASGFVSDLRNGVKATEALGNALGRLGDKLIDMALNQAINSLFSNLLGGAGGSSGSGGILNGIGKIFGFADGTSSAPGGLSWVGERGPELMNVPMGAQIIPNHRLSGPSVSRLQAPANNNAISAPVAISIDARGADNEGLARVQGQLNQLRAELPAHIVTTVRKAQKSRILS